MNRITSGEHWTSFILLAGPKTLAAVCLGFFVFFFVSTQAPVLSGFICSNLKPAMVSLAYHNKQLHGQPRTWRPPKMTL